MKNLPLEFYNDLLFRINEIAKKENLTEELNVCLVPDFLGGCMEILERVYSNTLLEEIRSSSIHSFVFFLAALKRLLTKQKDYLLNIEPFLEDELIGEEIASEIKDAFRIISQDVDILAQKVKEIEETIIPLKNEAENLKKQIKDLEAQKEQKEEENRKLSSKTQFLQNGYSECCERKKAFEENHSKIRNELIEINCQIDKINQDIRDVTKELKVTEAIKTTADEELSTVKDCRKFLQDHLEIKQKIDTARETYKILNEHYKANHKLGKSIPGAYEKIKSQLAKAESSLKEADSAIASIVKSREEVAKSIRMQING